MINWALIAMLYSVEHIDFVQELITINMLTNCGWSKNRIVSISEYKKMWAVSVSLESFATSEEMTQKMQWGYDIIDKYSQ